MHTSDVDFSCFSMETLVRNMASQPSRFADQVSTAQEFYQGFSKYHNEFLLPLLISTNYFSNVEITRLFSKSPLESFNAYMGLLEFNLDIFSRYFSGSLNALDEYNNRELKKGVTSWYNTVFNLKGEKLDGFVSRQSEMIYNVTTLFPQAIRDIEPEYGFHFERGENPVLAETERFIVYRIAPSDKSVKTDGKMKPVLIIPPYVLGSNILAFLPGENKSYAHSFANQGIPTYIRIMKDIETTPAFQTMTIEADALDTREFCEKIKAEHGKPVTLNGYCQGGYTALCNLLSGELDDLVDAFISCVAPMDGTRSQGLGKFLKTLPTQFNDLTYGTKTLPSGNKVADGMLMGWVYKLRSIEAEAPMVSFFRDMAMVTGKNNKPVKISKTAAALNYWLQNERSDLPIAVTEMSFASYNIPITEDGTLPVKMFGRKLNLKRIAEKKIAWLICYGEHDDLVEKETTLAPLDYVDAEVTAFPKGHVAIATSWSNPESACALHTRFGKEQARGPVRYHLDLDKVLDDGLKPVKPTPKKPSDPETKTAPPKSPTRPVPQKAAKPTPKATPASTPSKKANEKSAKKSTPKKVPGAAKARPRENKSDGGGEKTTRGSAPPQVKE
ncbi:MAG: metal transporter [Desulfobacterium sp.]|nr:metal transporter [Desulfobacterium sp.]